MGAAEEAVLRFFNGHNQEVNVEAFSAYEGKRSVSTKRAPSLHLAFKYIKILSFSWLVSHLISIAYIILYRYSGAPSDQGFNPELWFMILNTFKKDVPIHHSCTLRLVLISQGQALIGGSPNATALSREC